MTSTHERECAVCTNDFTTPKILPCGHLLCRQCVISWMDSKRDAGCPLCRCPIVEQSDGSSSDTVDALPTDFVMEALVESARVLSKDHLCCVCEDVRADFICLQCQDMMCSACAKVHKKMSISRSHDVESVSTVTPERLAASRPALCADHGDKQADSFCFCHRIVVCKSCKVQKHSECFKVSDFDFEIHSSENSLTHLTKILVEAEQKLEQAIGQLTSRLQEVDVSEQEDMAQVDKICECLQTLVEEFRMRLMEKSRTSHLQIRNSLRDVKTDLSNRLGKVTSHRHIVTRATAVLPRPALIHMTQALTDRVNSLDLSSHFDGDVWVKPLLSAKWCLDVVARIEQELLRLEQLKTETKTYLPSSSQQLNEAMKAGQMSSNTSVNITSLEDTKEVAKQTARHCYSENKASSGSDAFDSKRRSGNCAAVGKTNNNTKEEPEFRNERDDTFQCAILSKKERGCNVCRQLPENHHWSDHDTKVYREGYPNKRDNLKLNHNLKFYQGVLSSAPDGNFIDNIHKNWWGDHDLLERHNGYIQWLFPIRESSQNWYAQELQMHEAMAIQKDEIASERFLKSYEMMLDFYGLKLVDCNNGQVQRSEKWKERFHFLNHSTHNYLRITRILKCLGEMGLEHFKKPLIRFILNEAICKGTLDRTLDSCRNYWVGTLRKDEDRQEMEEYTKQLFHKKDNHS